MRVARVYVAELAETGALVELPQAAVRHLGRVLRMRVGQMVRLFDGRVEFQAQIEELGRRSMQVRLLSKHAEVCDTGVRLTLACSVIRPERMDWLLQKATELGVCTIQPVSTSRGHFTGRDADAQALKRQRHCRQLIISACEQCGRIDIPQLRPVTTLRNWLENSTQQSLRVYGHVQAAASCALPQSTDAVSVLVGPEGGWSREEVIALRQNGVVGVQLGPRTLRSETAGLVLITLMQCRYGDL